MFGVAVMFAYVAMGAVRLARFNSTTSVSDRKYFTGLAIPAAAGVIASLVVFDHHIVRMGAEVKPILVLIITLTLAFLMVSTIKYRSFKDLKFKGRQQITYLVWGILGADDGGRMAAGYAIRSLRQLRGALVRLNGCSG